MVIKRLRGLAALVLGLSFGNLTAHATIHYSGERYAPLPATWNGFLADHRMLRMIAQPPSPQTPPSLKRQEYQSAVKGLESRRANLSADEASDLGALYLRLGQIDQAISSLGPAARKFPKHFAVHANLGSAWQLAGDLTQAAEHLQVAVALASPENKPVEALHLKLVQSRMRRNNGLDELFPLKLTTADGQSRRGQFTAEERQQLPGNSIALTQRLALSLPHDARLLWQLGELAGVYGDAATAAQLLELCVGEYALSNAALRQSRATYLAASENRGGIVPIERQEKHINHAAGMKLEFKSRRPLIQEPFDINKLASQAGDAGLLAWPVLAETARDAREFKLTFHPYLKKLENKPVTLTGFLHPLTDDLDCTSFVLVENPIGCWYCTAPDLTGIVFVSMKPGSTARFTRNVITVTGSLKLNASDPNEFLFTIQDASVSTPQ
ncbi:MAG: DUF3299 domain-containing protein [Planctomycetia bacterium]|nr:DUF3299 domain-containing protein [Planctomycetia bacterium]